jgi:parallel beta-helix repeat protein
MRKLSLIFMMAFCFLLVPSVQSATLTVCGSGCNSTTIQDAINLAGSGDIIEVDSGIYNESLVINKSLSLEGAKSNIDPRGGAWGSGNISLIDAGEGNNGILITASNVTVNGFKIMESGSDAEIFSLDFPFESAIYTYNNSTELENITIIYNWADGNYGSGIIIRYAKEPIIEYNYISNNGAGVWAATGIGGQEITNGSFSYNEVFNSISYGMYFGGGKVGGIPKNTTSILISHNNLHGNEKYGLQLYGYYEPTSVSNTGIRLENNNFYDNGRCGIKVTDFTGTIIKNNNFSNNGIHGSSDKYKYGALISAYYTATGTQFINNTFSNNELGSIYLLMELEGVDLSNITINYNNLLDNMGIMTATRGAFAFPFMIEAENNYWGSAVMNLSKFYGNVTYYPFCLNAGCTTNIENTVNEFTGNSTTDFSIISNWSNVDLVLDSVNGKINWTAPIDLTESNMKFNDAVEISYRKIVVNINAMHELDQPAILTFKSTGFTSVSQFIVMRNGIPCPTDICTSRYLDVDGNVGLVVTQMSEYSLSLFPIGNLGIFGGVSLIVIGAGVLLFLMNLLFADVAALLKDPKILITGIIGAIIIVAVMAALLI